MVVETFVLFGSVPIIVNDFLLGDVGEAAVPLHQVAGGRLPDGNVLIGGPATNIGLALGNL